MVVTMKRLRKIHQKGATPDSIFTKTLQVKVLSFFSSSFLAKNIFDITEELHAIFESGAKFSKDCGRIRI